MFQFCSRMDPVQSAVIDYEDEGVPPMKRPRLDPIVEEDGVEFAETPSNERRVEVEDDTDIQSRKRPVSYSDEEPPRKRTIMEDGKITCDVCRVDVNRKNWARHLKSPTHKLNCYEKRSEENIQAPEVSIEKNTKRPLHDSGDEAKINKIVRDDGKIRCEVCKTDVMRKHWPRHLRTNTHEQNQQKYNNNISGEKMTEVPSNQELTTVDKMSTMCDVCNIKVVRKNWARHLKSASHKNRVDPQVPSSQASHSQLPPKPSTSKPSKSVKKVAARPSSNGESEGRPSQPAQPRRVTRSVTTGVEVLPSLKQPCPVCGTHVLLQSMKRHQQSQKCQHAFQVIEKGLRVIKKFGTTETNFEIKVNVVVDAEMAINRMISIAKERGGYTDGDRIIVVASHPKFRHDISMVLDARRKNSGESFMQHVENIISSNETINVKSIRWNVKVTNMPRGEGSRKILNLANDVRTKKCIVQIKNTDHLCGPRAVVTALTYHANEILGRPLSENDKVYIRKGRPLQLELAKELCNRIDRTEEDVGYTIEDFKKAEELLDVQIKLVCAENLNTIIYEGEPKDTILYLYKSGNHFDVIRSMAAFLGSIYYCPKCDTPYKNKNRIHRCRKTNVCSMCLGPAHNIRVPEMFCKECNRYCYNAVCLTEHSKRDGVCSKLYKCSTCNRIKKRGEKHSCEHYRCRNCEEVVEFNNHLCYMKRRVQKGGRCGRSDCLLCGDGRGTQKCTYTEKYIFFDFEARQESGEHVVNFVHAKDFYDDSWDFPDTESFCKWLFTDNHRGYTCIAHNAKGYDSYFILRYCVENTIKPFTIYSGLKILLLEVPQLRLKIIDSLSFVASPLSEFPKTFGLTQLKKGYFPHSFNTEENQFYVGDWPSTEYYAPDDMKEDVREDFFSWYAGRNKFLEEQDPDNPEYSRFELKRELEAYCRSDVDILRRSCINLRRQFLDIANIDPFCYITIASTCMAIYRSRYLQEDTLAVVNESEVEPRYSAKSISWLNSFPGHWRVKHALNGGEVWVLGAKVDGYCEETKTVYQFHGCFWHGCMQCYEPERLNPKNRHSMADLYNRTVERTKQLRSAGYTVVEKWECDWEQESRRLRLKPTPVVTEGLNPRAALYGGRTDACKLRVSGHKLRHIDVVSLYPTVMLKDRYPTGHPTKIVRPRQYDRAWFGFVKCKILPPRDLYHPVLPSRGKKLMFVLCRKCAEEKCPQCYHNEEERAIVGTWATVEVERALQKGYEILEVYEAWHFERSSEDLFKGYVRDFLKIKLETSPWEKEFDTLEDYKRAVRESVGIELDEKEIEDNPGKRAVAKLCLNTLWGKFGQRQNKNKTKFISEPKEFYSLMFDDRLDKTSVVFVNDNIVQVTYNHKHHFVEDSNNINVFVAAFTAAHARLRLHEMMDRLGKSVVYYDTDSIVYMDDGQNTVPTGCMLGEWHDELDAKDFIVDWVCTGPKSYAYKTARGKGTCKIKGFQLNHRNSLVLNIETMKSLVNCDIEKAQIVYNEICRDEVSKKLVNKKSIKTFKMDYDKRMIVKNDSEEGVVVDTVPWGYTRG